MATKFPLELAWLSLGVVERLGAVDVREDFVPAKSENDILLLKEH
jgi:hypothetical protein